MRVAYLVNKYPAISHTFVRREIRALESQGFRIARFSIRGTQDSLIDPADLEEAKQTVIVLQHGRCLAALLATLFRHPGRLAATAITSWGFWRRAGGGPIRPLAYLAEAAHLAQLLRRTGAEHLHAHFGTNSATVALLTRRLGGPPFSFTVHGPEEFDRPERESLREKIQAAQFVVAVSSFGRSQLQRWCDFRQWDKIRVVHCGLDQQMLQHEATPVPDVSRLVCVGRLTEQKGHFVLLQAARLLAREAIAFEIICVGDGDFRPHLEAFIRQYQLEGHVRLVGWQTEAEVRQWLDSSRAMVMPSFAEGLPVGIMEALAMGRPVISTFVAGIPELIVPPTNGWLVPPGDPDRLAAAMRTALTTDVATLTAMGKQGQLCVRQRHDVRLEAQKLAQAITGRLTEAPTGSECQERTK